MLGNVFTRPADGLEMSVVVIGLVFLAVLLFMFIRFVAGASQEKHRVDKKIMELAKRLDKMRQEMEEKTTRRNW